MQDSEEIKLVLVGNQSVGKTCIVRMATTGLFDEDTIATLGASYTSKTIVTETTEVRLQIWDTAGQERYRSMAPMYYRGSQVALVVYSVDRMDSFEAIDQWMESLRDNTESDLIVFIVANKADLEDSRAVTTQQGEEKAAMHNARFTEVSAKTGMGIDDLFNNIAKVYLELHKDSQKPEEITTNIKFSDATTSKKPGKCCK